MVKACASENKSAMHSTNGASKHYLIRYIRIAPVVQRLVYAHQLPYGAVLYVGIQVVHRGAFHELAPLVALMEHRMKLWQVYVVRGHVRSVVAWH